LEKIKNFNNTDLIQIDIDNNINQIKNEKKTIVKSNNTLYTIILADDNHLINSCNERIIKGIVKKDDLYKYEIIKVSDGLDVIKIFLNMENKEKIKLIITDENMDCFNGSEMIKFIRKVEKLNKLKKIKIASVSSEDDERHRNYLIDCGADFVFSKPLSKGNVRIALDGDVEN